MKISQIIASVLVMKSNIQVHHWMSESINQHTILGDLYEAVDEPLDMIVEVSALQQESQEGESISMKLDAGKSSPAESIQMINECIDIVKEMEAVLPRSSSAAVDSLYEAFDRAKYRLKLDLNTAYNSPA